ncbi:ATP-binding protein [Inquilinus sp. Marseille-Q2685]|uniref:PAS domain-containing sensor histidine kinase n=1 Tax=Inquilinus sp. Marseille-Q2685 TaxID=2866581 RepID=UPI001CE3CD8D|nr:ATP-binding protein [Inquilinus sp. Marseille-Q2685]
MTIRVVRKNPPKPRDSYAEIADGATWWSSRLNEGRLSKVPVIAIVDDDGVLLDHLRAVALGQGGGPGDQGAGDKPPVVHMDETLPFDDDPDAEAFADAPRLAAALWTLDTAGVRRFMTSRMAGGELCRADWVGGVLGRALVVDLDERGVHLLGGFGGRDEMIGRPIADFWPPESRADLAEMIAEVATDRSPGAKRTRGIGSLLLRDPVVTVSRLHEDGAGIVRVTVTGPVRDPRSYWAVRASEERYRNLIRHMPNPLLRIDATAMVPVFARLKAEGVYDLDSYLDSHPELLDLAKRSVRVTEINPSAAALFGAARAADLLGPVDYLFEASPDTPRRIMVAHFEGRRSHAELIKLRRLDGRLRDVQFAVTYPAPPELRDVTVVSLDDVTDRLRTEAQLRQLQADFARAARISTLGELATSIAHEVNQPLAAIFTNAETSLRWLSRDEPNLAKVAQLTTRIVASARHANEIVQRIRAMTARHAPEWRPLDLNEVVEEALPFLRHDIESRAIRLSTKLGLGLPRVIGDRVQLQQAIVNLLVNGVQAIGQAGAQDGHIELGTGLGPAGEVVCTVRDDGPGIPEEDLDRIFEGFFTTRDEGMGLGLAICRSIMTAHGGGIAASNRPEGGACFRLWLPAEPARGQGQQGTAGA